MKVGPSRRPRPTWLPLTSALALLFALLHGCGLVDFQTPEQLGGPCPPCAAGQTCYRVTSLGGEDFCTEACDPKDPVDSDHVCEQNGALLTRCNPDNADATADCPRGLNCYRTNLLNDDGVCLKVPVCKEDKDCAQASGRPTCATSLIKRGRASIPDGIRLDHLHCLLADCFRFGKECSPGTETCLGAVYQTPSADFCTPACDGARNCPPNFSCDTATSGENQAGVCIPGLPGSRCSQPHCLLGSCVDTGAGFNVCGTPCLNDPMCTPLDTRTERYQCATVDDKNKFCLTPLPFHGANCSPEEMPCELGEECSQYSDIGIHNTHGECHVPCKPDGTCDPRGGLPHVCLPDDTCYPGQLGVECRQSSSPGCFKGLTCELVAGDATIDLSAKTVCTMPCVTDGDCNLEKGFNFNGFCSAGLCRVRLESGTKCTRNEQCISSTCHLDERRCGPS